MRGGGCEIDVEDWWWCRDAEGVEAEGVGGAGGMTMERGRRKLWMIMWMRAVVSYEGERRIRSEYRDHGCTGRRMNAPGTATWLRRECTVVNMLSCSYKNGIQTFAFSVINVDESRSYAMHERHLRDWQLL